MYTSAAWRNAAWLNKIEIKEIVYCLYICTSRQLVVRGLNVIKGRIDVEVGIVAMYCGVLDV